MHAIHGVCSFGLTFFNRIEPGSWSSRAMPKQRRMVFAWIASRQTTIAIETTTRYVVANAFEKFASMICAGPRPFLTASASLKSQGIAISIPAKR